MDLCRQKGVIKLVRSGDSLELLFGPAPAQAAKKENGKDDRAVRREHYSNMLGRPVTDGELDLLP